MGGIQKGGRGHPAPRAQASYLRYTANEPGIRSLTSSTHILFCFVSFPPSVSRANGARGATRTGAMHMSGLPADFDPLSPSMDHLSMIDQASKGRSQPSVSCHFFFFSCWGAFLILELKMIILLSPSAFMLFFLSWPCLVMMLIWVHVHARVDSLVQVC